MTTPDIFRYTVENIERELASLGWDQAPALFALVSHRWLADNLPSPDEASDEEKSLLEQVADNPDGLTAVLQQTDPQTDLDSLLQQVVFPDNVYGAALSLERIILPPDQAALLPADDAEREAFLANNPQREDVRIVGAVSRNGDSWCALRTRKHDDDARVVTGERLVPDLIDALARTLEPDA